MKSLNLLKKISNIPVFGTVELMRITNKDRRYCNQILQRLEKKDLIKQISKGKYTTQDNIHVIASNLVIPSYISFWSASNFLGHTEQIPTTIQVATTVKKKSIEFIGYMIKFIPVKEFFGYRKITTETGDIFIAENEKLIIDALLRHREMGNFEEIKKIVQYAEIDEKKMTEYLRRTQKESVTKRAGYMLETLREIDLSKNFKLSRNYVTLNPFTKEYKKTNTKWRIRQ